MSILSLRELQERQLVSESIRASVWHRKDKHILKIICINMSSRVRVIFTLVLFALLCGSSAACKCMPPAAVSESYAATDAVFIGKAVHVANDANTLSKTVRFQVKRVFKGLPCGLKQITVRTNRDSAACGVPIERGQMWQIWTAKSGSELLVNSCSRSTTAIKRDLQFLRQQANCIAWDENDRHLVFLK